MFSPPTIPSSTSAKAPSSSSPHHIITIHLSTHPPQTPLGIILAPSKLFTDNEYHHNHHHNHHHSHSHYPQKQTTNITMHDVSHYNPQNSTTIVLVGYTRHNHKMGPIQKSNLVRIGDVLVEINGVSVRNMSFRRVLDLLKCFVYGGMNPNGGGNNGGMMNSGIGNGVLTGNSGGAGTGGIGMNSNSGSGTNLNMMGAALTSIAFEDGRQYYAKYGPKIHPNAGGDLLNSYSLNNQWNLTKENTLYMFHSWIDRARLRREEEKGGGSGGGGGDGMSVDHDMNDIQPQVHFEDHHADSNHKNNNNNNNQQNTLFVQYEIKCHLKIKQNNQEEEETTWSVWKRYSEIKELDQHLRKTFHWSMEGTSTAGGVVDGITAISTMGGIGVSTTNTNNSMSTPGVQFPSSNVLQFAMYGPTHPKFVQKRKHELELYWRKLQNYVDGVFDFGDPTSSHRYSYKMADFLNVKREYFQPKRLNSGIMNHITGGNNSTGGGFSVSAGSRPSVIRVESNGGGGNGGLGGEGNHLDGSNVSILSNSVDGRGVATVGGGGGGGSVNGATGSQAANSGSENRSLERSLERSIASGPGGSLVSGLGGKKKKKRKKLAAKSAYQRRLMEDL